MAGQEVQDLEDERAQFTIDLGKGENFHSVDDVKKLNASLKNAKMAQESAKPAHEGARTNLNAKPVNRKPLPVKDGRPDTQAVRNQFAGDLKSLVVSGTTGTSNTGLTIPGDIRLQIKTLTRSFVSLESLVNVENVTISHGSHVYEELANTTLLKDLDDGSALIGDDNDPELTVVRYLIHRYAGVTTVTNTLLEGTVDNIIQWLVNWAAKKGVVTRSAKTLEIMGKAPKKLTISRFDGIKDLENNALDSATESTSSFITNQSRYSTLSKLKDANGRYLMQPDATSPDKYVVDGKPVIHMADKWLPDVSRSHPPYSDDSEQSITSFDCQQMQIDTTNAGAGPFRHDTTKLRFTDRFDVQLIDDGISVAASSKTVADRAKGTADTSKQLEVVLNGHLS